MADRIDHAAEARSALSGSGDGRNFATDASVNAVAHALLALVEQQRIANLVAIAHGTDGALSTALRDLAYITLGDDGINPDIASALGIGL